MKNWQSTLLFDATALLLGVCATFSFAPFGIFPLAVLAPMGLLYLWTQSSNKQAFWSGFVFGLGLFGTGVYWVFHSIHVYGGVDVIPAVLLTAALISFLSLFSGISGYLLNRFFPSQNSAKLIFAFPAIWVMMDWVRSYVGTGFPWLFLGYSQTNSPLKGYAAILSVYGVTLFTVISSGLLLSAYFNYRQKNIRSVYLNILSMMLIWILGALFAYIPWTQPQGKPISVSLVQGNIPQELKWEPNQIQLSLDRYEALTKPILKKDSLIIWPEAAVPLPFHNAFLYLNKMDHLATRANATIMLGIPIQTAENNFYNAIITLGVGQKQFYAKRRLVPFGEYTPSIPLLAKVMDVMQIPMSDMTPGQRNQEPFVFNEIKILPSICYEIAFPDLMRVNDKSIGLLLTLTNDAWFGKSSAQAQHLQMAQMRALEFKRPLLFVGNDGITAIINPDGKIVKAAPAHQSYVLEGAVQPMYGITPWMKNGSDLILFVLIAFLIYARRVHHFALNVPKTSESANQIVDEKN